MPQPFATQNDAVRTRIIQDSAMHTIRGESELIWVSKQHFLQSKGYMLRPRYSPDWKPSWYYPENKDMDPRTCEDYYRFGMKGAIIDARRMSDDRLVCIKRINTTLRDGSEARIAPMFSQGPLKDDPRNHCVPILDIFQDAENPDLTYLVMPFLRPLHKPPFETVSGVIDFVSQMLEGLVFMHEQGVAHRDCSEMNVMMDADSLFPEGYHPVLLDNDPTTERKCKQLSRGDTVIKYYYIDFGISSHFPPRWEGPRLVTGYQGRDRDVPELDLDAPYDPFKTDIRILGNLFRTYFYEKYDNVAFLEPIIDAMSSDIPAERCDAWDAERMWHEIVTTEVSFLHRAWRLRPKNEDWAEAVIGKSTSLVDCTLRVGRSMFAWLSDLSG